MFGDVRPARSEQQTFTTIFARGIVSGGMHRQVHQIARIQNQDFFSSVISTVVSED
ncbi:hypothetical protein SAMN04487787_11622 [Kosakonia sacchari]|nr:hypothetical protein SAMN04487787_11622 [Kosakonia sacchari]